jgi:hypothetical protein
MKVVSEMWTCTGIETGVALGMAFSDVVRR